MTATKDKIPIVVLGAGVIGLTCAKQLSEDGRFNITVLAKHMPGDYDIQYASPWAGANYLPVGKPGSLLQDLERRTWPELERLARDVPEAAIHFQNTKLFNRNKDGQGPIGEWVKELIRPDPWYKDIVPDFRILKESELPEGHDSGTGFTSVCINTAIYLPWLLSNCLKNGCVFKRATLQDIHEAFNLHHSGKQAKLVINCTGLGSLKLGSVEDSKMYPARGQIVLVRNDPGVMSSTSGSDDGPDESFYTMTRAAGGGTILGGCLQAHSWESQPDASLAVRIMNRSVKVVPSLVPSGKGIEALDVIRHGVGLRPMREGGPRVEAETLKNENGELQVVHCYGHGGYGYQSSYGSSETVMQLVKKVLDLKERSKL